MLSLLITNFSGMNNSDQNRLNNYTEENFHQLEQMNGSKLLNESTIANVIPE